MSWVALDRAEPIVHKLDMQADLEPWQFAKASNRRTVFDAGYSHSLGSFVQSLGSEEVDATALTFVGLGFIEQDNPRTASTIRAIRPD